MPIRHTARRLRPPQSAGRSLPDLPQASDCRTIYFHGGSTLQSSIIKVALEAATQLG
jgi:hypothetical protein